MAANSRGVSELNDLIERLDGLILSLASATGDILLLKYRSDRLFKFSIVAKLDSNVWVEDEVFRRKLVFGKVEGLLGHFTSTLYDCHIT